jgi:hypothetical protein
MGDDRLYNSLCLIFENIVLHNYQVAGHGDGVVRLSRDNQAKCLKVTGDREMVAFFAAGWQHFAKIDGSSFRGDCPQDVGEVFGTESVGGAQATDVCVDHGSAKFAIDFCFAFSAGQKAGALEADMSGAAAMEVIDGRNIAGYYFNLVEGHAVGLARRRHGNKLARL